MRNGQWILLLCMSLVAAVQAAEAQPGNEVSTPAVLVAESAYGFEETVQSLRSIIGGSNFRMIREQPWDYGLENGSKGNRDIVLYFCNFDMVNRAIKRDQRVGQFLPFRLTVVEQGDRVLVMAIDPQSLEPVLDDPEIGGLRTRVAAMYRDLIDEGLF